MKKRKELLKAAAVQARREQTAQRLSFAACADVTTCLTHLHSRITGLTEEQVDEHRAQFGANRVTHEKAKPLGARIVEAFINPFTAILLCLALVSCATDIFIPLWNHSPEEVSPVTVAIILTMVIISGTLRFVQESRSGHAAAFLQCPSPGDMNSHHFSAVPTSGMVFYRSFSFCCLPPQPSPVIFCWG